MSLENQGDTLEKRILDAEKYWREFLSELPLRQVNLSLASKTLKINVVTSLEFNETEK
jgi:hypothetical protein